MTKAQAKCPAGRETWMIYVRSNSMFEGALHYSATIYFTPDTQNSRLRTGQYMSVDSLFDQYRAKVREKLGVQEEALPKYAQVSRVSKQFGQKLETPDDEDRPFHFPENMSEIDLVALIDEARTGLSTGADPDAVGEPVCRIETPREPQGEFEVYFGAQDGGLAGRGTVIVVERKSTIFKAKGVAHWVS